MKRFWRRLAPHGGRVRVDSVWVDRRCTPLRRMARSRIARGGYERAERELLREFLCSGDRVLECGGFIGILTSIMSKCVGTTGRVVSVEPNPALRADFEHQLAINDTEATLVQGLCCPVWEDEVPPDWSRRGFRANANNLSGRASAETGTYATWHTLKTVARAPISSRRS